MAKADKEPVVEEAPPAAVEPDTGEGASANYPNEQYRGVVVQMENGGVSVVFADPATIEEMYPGSTILRYEDGGEIEGAAPASTEGNAVIAGNKPADVAEQEPADVSSDATEVAEG